MAGSGSMSGRVPAANWLKMVNAPVNPLPQLTRREVHLAAIYL
jgi:hypothetical protein